MNISAEAWDLIKIGFAAYISYRLNTSDKNQRELYNRMRRQEITCARNHGHCAGEVVGAEQ